jgi:hypothetical protein
VRESSGTVSLPAAGIPSITAMKPITSYTIRIPDENNRPMVTIHPDGRIEFGEAYEPDEAARMFWASVRRFAPSLEEREFGVPLTARINTELARGEQAERLLRATLITYAAVHSEWTDSHTFEELPSCLMCADAARMRAFLNRTPS